MIQKVREKLLTYYRNLEINEDSNTVDYYTSASEEISTFYNSSAVFDASHYSIFRMTGKDVLDFLNRISTNDTISLPIDSCLTTLLLNEKGRLIDKVKLLRFKDFCYLIASPQNSARVERWINRYIIIDDVVLENYNNQLMYLKIFGSNVESFIALLFNDQIKSLGINQIKEYLTSDFHCTLMKTRVLENCIGYEILCHNDYALQMLDYIFSNLKFFDSKFIGNKAFDTLRIEWGEPVYPNEINDSINPHELLMKNYIDNGKGCYIGQEVVARLETYDKVQKYLCGFILPDNHQIQQTKIYSNEIEVGYLTSVTFSQRLHKNIGLGFIKKEINNQSNNLTFSKNNSSEKIIKVELPFVEL